jgi:lysyl-tRNA synthetase class 2
MILRTRSKIIRFIRDFFDQRGFLEVETPILSGKAGGASARPFATHAHALDMDMQLRIAPELYLKQLVIGGIDRVYEIGKQFRNEGVDADHNPEFTTCEFYQAYGNLDSLMQDTETLLSEMAACVCDTSSIVSKSGVRIDFQSPFNRINVVDRLSIELDTSLAFLENEGTLILDNCIKKSLIHRLFFCRRIGPIGFTLYKAWGQAVRAADASSNSR